MEKGFTDILRKFNSPLILPEYYPHSMSSFVSRLIALDGRVVLGVAQRRTASLNVLMIAFSKLGDGWAWVAYGLLVLILDARGSAEALLPVIAGLMLDIPVYCLLKHKFSRPRPYDATSTVSCLISPLDRFSFPSGHTSVAFVVLTAAGAFYLWLVPLLAVVAVLIGISRVYLGVHYPSDVLAGALLGTACGIIGVWLF